MHWHRELLTVLKNLPKVDNMTTVDNIKMGIKSSIRAYDLFQVFFFKCANITCK